MKFLRLAGMGVGLILSLIFQVFAVVVVQLSNNDPTVSRDPVYFIPLLVFALIPFIIVYRCFCTEEMEEYFILGIPVRPQAILRALLAQACVGVAVCFLFLWFAYFMKHSA